MLNGAASSEGRGAFTKVLSYSAHSAVRKQGLAFRARAAASDEVLKPISLHFIPDHQGNFKIYLRKEFWVESRETCKAHQNSVINDTKSR